MNKVISCSGPSAQYDVEDSHLVEINKSGLAYNPSWLYEKVTEGVLSETNIAEILSMADILESGFPGLWDIQAAIVQYTYTIKFQNEGGYGLREFTQTRKINKLYFKIILRFPEITIKNSRRGSHEIRDLYVMTRYCQDITSLAILYLVSDPEDKLIRHPELITYDSMYVKFDNYTISGNTLDGMRETLSIYEKSSMYSHSHLPRGATANGYELKWARFCLGSGDIIPTMSSLSNTYNANLFNLFLYQIDAYVKWESIEGTPHIRIDTINQGGRLNQLPNISDNTCRQYLGQIKQRLESDSDPLELDWKIESGQLKIIENQRFEDFIKISPNPRRYGSNIIFYQDEEGNYYSKEASTTPAMPHVPDVTHLFRGEDRPFKIYTPDRIELKPNFIIHPQIKQYIKFKLESHANFSRIKSSISNRANQIAHSSRGLRQNTAHV
jgi:hypothetical protein